MAVRHPAGTSQFSPVVTGHRVEILGIQAVDADAIAAMFNPGTVHVAALSEMDADMGAALRGAEENQVSGQ